MKRRCSEAGRLADQRGFTLIELSIVAAFIAILATISFLLYVNLQVRARVAQAQSDARSLASAATLYTAHVGAMPPSLTALTSPALNPDGESAGPFMASLPTPPTGWAAYAYTSSSAGTFSITTSGDNTTVIVP